MDPLKFQLNQHQHPSTDSQLPLQVDQTPHQTTQPKIEEPRIGSFIKEVPTNPDENLTLEQEESFEDLDPEEKRDYTLSIAFTLIAALTLIAGGAYYVKHYVKASKSDPVPELFINSTDGSNTGDDSESGGTLNQTSLNAADELVRKYTENLNSEGVKVLPQASSTNTNNATTIKTQSLTELVTSKELGISFLKDPFWSQTTKGDSIVLKNVGPAGKDIIYITRFLGKSVITEDETNGSVIYFYNTEQKTWMRIEYTGELEKQSSLIPEAFAPIRATKDRKPIFDGTNRIKTSIVALNIDDFIIVNISGSGYSAILDSFVSGIRGLE